MDDTSQILSLKQFINEKYLIHVNAKAFDMIRKLLCMGQDDFLILRAEKDNDLIDFERFRTVQIHQKGELLAQIDNYDRMSFTH
jgi:hypothetical protein